MLTHTLIVFHTLTVEEYFVKCLLPSYSAHVCRFSPQSGVTLATYELLNRLPYTAKLSRGKTFAVGIENDRSRENFRSSSISQ